MYSKFNNFVMLTNYSFNLLGKMVKWKGLQSKTSNEASTCKDTTDNEPKKRKVTRSNKWKKWKTSIQKKCTWQCVRFMWWWNYKKTSQCKHCMINYCQIDVNMV